MLALLCARGRAHDCGIEDRAGQTGADRDMAQNGSDTPNLYGVDLGKFVTSEVARWGEMVRKSAVKLN